ncbi:MAG: tetratricopeptide repeat protein, partial [Nitrospirota bacterium]|nr:tetratricopeptide repeat protein [Nitrospirota bacterium]
ARADMHAVLLLLLAVVLWVTLPMFIGSYALSDGSQSIFSLMPTVLGLLPMAMTVKFLAGRFRGRAEPAEKKLLWAGLSSMVLAATVLVFFILSPFSFYYFFGDLGMKTGNLMQANYWYGRALEEAPDDNGVIFDMGVLLREKKEYEAAFTYLQRAYEKDPKNFGPLGLELLPDTLLKAGRYDEAIAWCDKILNAKSRNRMVREVIEKKRIEIIAEKKRLGNASQSAVELL